MCRSVLLHLHEILITLQPIFEVLFGAFQAAPLVTVALSALLYGVTQTQLIPLARILGFDAPLCSALCTDTFRLIANCDSVCAGE